MGDCDNAEHDSDQYSAEVELEQYHTEIDHARVERSPAIIQGLRGWTELLTGAAVDPAALFALRSVMGWPDQLFDSALVHFVLERMLGESTLSQIFHPDTDGPHGLFHSLGFHYSPDHYSGRSSADEKRGTAWPFPNDFARCILLMSGQYDVETESDVVGRYGGVACAPLQQTDGTSAAATLLRSAGRTPGSVDVKARAVVLIVPPLPTTLPFSIWPLDLTRLVLTPRLVLPHEVAISGHEASAELLR